MQLLINGKEVAPRSGTSLRIIRTNPLFSEQGDYSLEVSLPLSHPVNLSVFGAIQLPETQKNTLLQKRWTAQLVAPPIVMEGEVKVTAVTDLDVKVQFISGKRRLTDVLHGGEQYIDQLSLGESWREFPSWSNGADSFEPATMTAEQFKLALHDFGKRSGDLHRYPELLMRGDFYDTDAVLYPAMAHDRNAVVNQTATKAVRDLHQNLVKPRGWYYLLEKPDELHTLVLSSNYLSPQPYLFVMWRAIINALGLNAAYDGDYTDSGAWTRNIFIVNAHSGLERAKCLPHWTVKEFIHEMENFLGAVVEVEDNGKDVNIVSRVNYYKDSTRRVYISRPLDERSTEIDDEGEQSSSAGGNVGYQFPEEDNVITVPASVWNGANIKRVPNLTAIQQEVAAMSEDEKALSPYLWVTPEATYALLHRADATSTYELSQVDQFPPLIRDYKNRDKMDTELRIVPARMELPKVWRHECEGFPVLVSHTAEQYAPPIFNVDAAINNGDGSAPTSDLPSEKDKPDVMTVALNAPDGWSLFEKSHDGNGELKLPVGIPFTRDNISGLPVVFPKDVGHGDPNPGGPFSLSEAYTGRDNFAYGTIHDLIEPPTDSPSAAPTTIDQRVEYRISFADNLDTYDPRRPYVINGALYACKQLELTIDADGIKPIKQGIFYRLT